MSTNPNYPYNFLGTHNFIDDAIQNGPNEFFNFNDEALRLLFFNDMFRPLRYPHTIKEGTEELISGVPCRINNEGFRSDNFVKGTDVLLTGCSQTYGMGVLEEFIWPNIVKNNLSLSVSNLGQPGASWTMIVNNLFAYFKKYGHPKVIGIVFPNTERFQMPVNRNIMITEYWNQRDREKELASWDSLGDEYLQLTYLQQFPGPKYSKRPHVAKDVLPHDYPYYLCMQSINRLEQYCELAGIKLIWTTWDFTTGKSIEIMKQKDPSYFTNYFDLKMDHWCHPVKQVPDLYHPETIEIDDACLREEACDKILYCHEQLKNQTIDFFELGLDNGHWGSHRHAHVAESFLEKISEAL